MAPRIPDLYAPSSGGSNASRSKPLPPIAPAGPRGVRVRQPAPRQPSRISVAANGRTGVKIKAPTYSGERQRTVSGQRSRPVVQPKSTAPTYSTAMATPTTYSAPVQQSVMQPSLAVPTETPAPSPIPTTETITIPDAKADATYQQQVADLARALTNYQAQQALAKSQYDQNYGQNLTDLGFDTGTNSWDQNGQGAFGQTFRSNEGDFAGRGAYWSGQYGKAVGDLTNAFDRQRTGLTNARDQYLSAQQMAGTQYGEQNTIDKQRALSDAVSRIAAQYGLDMSQVPQGTGAKTITRPIGG